MEHLSNDQEDCPNQHENSHKLCNEKGVMKKGIPFLVYYKVNGIRDNNMIKISQWRKAIVEQIL